MKVVVLYNEASEDASVDERDILAQRDAVTSALRQLGHVATPLSCTLDLSLAKSRLEELRPDAVFNLVESLGGTDRLMPAATLLLEALNLPYTGNPTCSILATSNKLGAKEQLRSAELPTPDWWTGSRLRATGYGLQEKQSQFKDAESRTPSPLAGEGRGGGASDHRLDTSKFAFSPRPPVAASPRHPRHESDPSHHNQLGSRVTLPSPTRVIVKAIWEHASFHMDDDAVVSLAAGASLDEILRSRDELTGRPHFAEAFIDGREFNLTLLAGPDGPQVLPPAEIEFAFYPDDKPKIVGYRAKWDEDSFEYVNTPRRFEFLPQDQRLLKRLDDLAKHCWHVFDLRGYARVDFRVDDAGEPWILEVNANPCLAPDAGFAAAVERAGIGYDQAIGRILDDTGNSAGSDVDRTHFTKGVAAAHDE